MMCNQHRLRVAREVDFILRIGKRQRRHIVRQDITRLFVRVSDAVIGVVQVLANTRILGALAGESKKDGLIYRHKYSGFGKSGQEFVGLSKLNET